MNRHSSLAIALSFAVLLSSRANAADPIQWTPSTINHTIGNGQGSNDSVTAGFTSNAPLDNVTLEVVPALSGFVTVEPSSIQHLTANSLYNVKLQFAIPPGTVPGNYSGTLHVRSGNRTLPQTLTITVTVQFGQNEIRPGTSVLSPQTTQFLGSISPDHSTLLFTQTTMRLPGTPLKVSDSRPS